MNNDELEVICSTGLRINKISWIALDERLVKEVDKLIKENKKLKKEVNNMFDMDKIITEANKEYLFGKKPKVPEKLNTTIITNINGCGQDCEQPPSNMQIMKKINEIITYLEWIDK